MVRVPSHRGPTHPGEMLIADSTPLELMGG